MAKDGLLNLTADIVSAHVSHSQVGAADLVVLIETVYHSLASAGVEQVEPVVAKTPAVPVKKSVFPDYIICLEDGRKLKMLKRHLRTSYNMSADEYRTKWKLPPDYPMVAPAYAATRSSLAKLIGLGRKPGPVEAAEPKVTIAKARKARGSKW